MFGFHIATDRETEATAALQTRLEEEIRYLRGQLDAEQQRNERLMDNLCLVNGTPPVSNEARADVKGKQAKIAKLGEGLKELFMEETVIEEESAEETLATLN
jgi:Fe-S cluster assembly scaffold protein SufB